MSQRSECQLLRSSGHSKLDDSLRGSIARGCSDTKSVIIRTKPGAREALRKSLAAQGRRVKGEFPALDAITADVSCADLNALAGFRETASISDNAKVHGHQLGARRTGRSIVEEITGGSLLSAYSSNSAKSGVHSSQSTSRLNEALVSAAASDESVFDARRATVAVGARSGFMTMPSIGVAVIDSGIAPGT